MKKILYTLVSGLLLFTACNKQEDPIFDKTPEERIEAVETEYKQKLTAGTGKWITYYAGEAILMTFKADNTVTFESTFYDGYFDLPISYRVSVSQVPTLVFENYSVFQALYQQNLSTGEYEFVFDALEDGKIGFVSKTDLGPNKTKMYFYSAVGDEIDKVKVKQAQIRGLSQFITVVDADNPSVKMGLVFNTDGTATLNTLKGEETTSQTFDYFATVEGLGFMPALSFGGKLLGELFKYDDVKKAFVSVDNSKVSIVEGMTPPLPLPAYTIGARAYAAYNYLDAYKSSLAFSEFYTAFAANMKANGLEITSWSLQDLKLPVSYLSIKTKGGNFWFDFTREVKEDGKVYLTLTGDNNAAEKLTYMQPLIDILFDTNGLYYFASGKLAAYSNKTFSIISAADPHIKIDFYEGGS